ncbi:MAG: hypothetical protein JWM88_3228 [Verrucomicrobia bacterium]|nr:hypothetical protein [Verrucomicrobiota bacterium]
MRWRLLLWLVAALGWTGALRAAEVIPPAPRNHFNDYAGIVRTDTAAQLEAELTQFERDTSNQILVAIYPHLQSDSSIEDYTVRVAQAWKAGRQDRKNGAVLFVFSQDRKLFIQVGYGLEGVLPDARCKQIVENEITPRFRAGDFTGGVAAGVHAMLASVRGEYQGTGKTVADTARTRSGGLPPGLIFAAIVVVIIASSLRRRRSFGYSRGGRFFPVYTGGNWGGGGRSGGGGGGSFSGGGGGFGGGGAGGSW